MHQRSNMGNLNSVSSMLLGVAPYGLVVRFWDQGVSSENTKPIGEFLPPVRYLDAKVHVPTVVSYFLLAKRLVDVSEILQRGLASSSAGRGGSD